jgi:membrane protein implicated in regulation of membrane protease activity
MTADAPGEKFMHSDDSGYGLAMLVIFTGAALIVTGAVALLALVGSWWMLAVAFAVHVGMTAVVTLAGIHAIDGRRIAVGSSDVQPVGELPRIEPGPLRGAIAAQP